MCHPECDTKNPTRIFNVNCTEKGKVILPTYRPTEVLVFLEWLITKILQKLESDYATVGQCFEFQNIVPESLLCHIKRVIRQILLQKLYLLYWCDIESNYCNKSQV